MHSANTLMANIIPYAERLRLGADDIVLMASPMAHQTGFMYGLMMPIMLKAQRRAAGHLGPGQGGRPDPHASGATFTMASTPFLTDLTQRRRGDRPGACRRCRTFLCAGAPIPGPLVEQARAGLGAKIVSAWGMTENGAVTLIKLDDDDELAFTTDGCALPGVEVKVVDADGDERAGRRIAASWWCAPARISAAISSARNGTAPTPRAGSTPATSPTWTRDGYIRISGRSKDVIIRGGENIPVVEIEALLYRHPAVAQVAIVAYPDERLGERACAVVVPKAGQTIDFAGMSDFLKAQKVARPVHPGEADRRATPCPRRPREKSRSSGCARCCAKESCRPPAIGAATTPRSEKCRRVGRSACLEDPILIVEREGRVGVVTLNRPEVAQRSQRRSHGRARRGARGVRRR